MRLFLADGFDATTVEMIAAAADVSPMTCFRYFRTKEDLVLSDDYDVLIASMIEAEPPVLGPVDRIQNGVLKAIDKVWDEDRELVLARSQLLMRTPQLRARLWEQQSATVEILARSLGPRSGSSDFELRVVAAACLSTMTVAVEYWASHPDKADLSDLLRNGFRTLREGLR